jgi:DNA processing protein
MSQMAPEVRQFTPRELMGRPLNDIEEKDAPRSLFVAGDDTVLRDAPAVSVVGARDASTRGVDVARRMATWLARHAIVVVSGLADGIDTAAHSAAITVLGRTVAVLGTPLSDCYPATNRALQQRIMREHLAISQFPPGRRAQPGNFPRRNKTMALLSDATVIIEARDKSGSLHQAWEALRLGRPLFIMQSQRADPTLAWPRELERYGAQVLDADQWDALLDALPEKSRGASTSLTL